MKDGRLKVSFTVYLTFDGEISCVTRCCKLPCDCKKCKFNKICDKIEQQIIKLKRR